LNILTFFLTALALQVWFLMVTLMCGFTRGRSVFLIQIHMLRLKVRVKKCYIEILTVKGLYEG